MNVIKKEKLYEGKAKVIYTTDNPDYIIQFFKDDATAFNAQKKGIIIGKGECNARISVKLFKLLSSQNIPTHFIDVISNREILTKRLEIIPIEVVIRNVAAGSLSKRLGLSEGYTLPQPVLEYYYKNDELGDPMINEYHIYCLKLATYKDLKIITDMSFKINNILSEYLDSINLILVDFKLEFGRDKCNNIYLADEISPDTCRLWDKETKTKLDKDRFRHDLGEVESAYQEVLRRME